MAQRISHAFLDEAPRDEWRPGFAYVFVLPFDVYHTVTHDLFEFVLDGRRATLFRPFLNRDAMAPYRPTLKFNALPTLPGQPRFGKRAPAVAHMEVQHRLSSSAQVADALRLDIEGDEDSELAERFVAAFLTMARFATMQWWIGRGSPTLGGDLRCVYPVSAHGHVRLPIKAMYRSEPGLKYDRVLTTEKFASAVSDAAKGRSAPLGVLSFCDALLSYARRDVRSTMVTAAVTCELLLVEQGHQIAAALSVSPSLVKRHLEKAKFEHRLDEGLRALTGRSFAEEDTVAYAWLVALWIARNNVAHGKEAITRVEGRTRAVSQADERRMLRAVNNLMAWLGDFAPYTSVAS